jgi:membrane protein DedA with SNARE-associated domain
MPGLSGNANGTSQYNQLLNLCQNPILFLYALTQHSFMLESILDTYGYPIITIGTFLEGKTVLIPGGVSAHPGCLSLHWVTACGYIGTLLGDQRPGRSK